MNTFGPINWREFYSISKRHRAADKRAQKKARLLLRPVILPPNPCIECETRNCHKPINPDYPSFCPVYGQWVFEAWRTVVTVVRRFR